MAQNMSGILSKRKIQPGTINTGRNSEYDFETAVNMWIKQKENNADCNLEYFGQPHQLEHLFGKYGIRPEGMLVLDNKYAWFFEVKYQKAGGNAQERVYRLFTFPFQRTLANFIFKEYGYLPHKHPYSAIFTGALASREKYLSEFACCLEKDSYIIWNDKTDILIVHTYLDTILEYLIEEKERDQS